MNDDIKFREENMARLIQAGLGGEARLGQDKRRELLSRLKGEIRPRSTGFSEWALGSMVVLEVLVGLWSAIQFGQYGWSILDDARWLALVLPAVINLMLAPVASIVIVLKRRQHV